MHYAVASFFFLIASTHCFAIRFGGEGKCTDIFCEKNTTMYVHYPTTDFPTAESPYIMVYSSPLRMSPESIANAEKIFGLSPRDSLACELMLPNKKTFSLLSCLGRRKKHPVYFDVTPRDIRGLIASFIVGHEFPHDQETFARQNRENLRMVKKHLSDVGTRIPYAKKSTGCPSLPMCCM